jgi:hypothetical protein
MGQQVNVRSSRSVQTLKDFENIIRDVSEGRDVIVVQASYDPVHTSMRDGQKIDRVMVPKHAVRLHFRKVNGSDADYSVMQIVQNPVQFRKDVFKLASLSGTAILETVNGKRCAVTGQLPTGIQLFGSRSFGQKGQYVLESLG